MEPRPRHIVTFVDDDDVDGDYDYDDYGNYDDYDDDDYDDCDDYGHLCLASIMDWTNMISILGKYKLQLGQQFIAIKGNRYCDWTNIYYNWTNIYYNWTNM